MTDVNIHRGVIQGTIQGQQAGGVPRVPSPPAPDIPDRCSLDPCGAVAGPGRRGTLFPAVAVTMTVVVFTVAVPATIAVLVTVAVSTVAVSVTVAVCVPACVFVLDRCGVCVPYAVTTIIQNTIM